MSLDDIPDTALLRAMRAGKTTVRPGGKRARTDKLTRAEELRLQLADEIVRGALAPGAALDETDIARRFNVSRTPVREALRQLSASGPDRGARPSRRGGRAAIDRTPGRNV